MPSCGDCPSPTRGEVSGASEEVEAAKDGRAGGFRIPGKGAKGASGGGSILTTGGACTRSKMAPK